MADVKQQHALRLRIMSVAFLASIAVYGLIVSSIVPPSGATLAQARHLLWALAAVAVVNLVTIMPVYRAMLAGPRRVFAVSQQAGPLLQAHLGAHAVAFARLEAIALFGLALHFLAARADWFWGFATVALVGMLLLWPSQAKVDALLAGPAAPTPT